MQPREQREQLYTRKNPPPSLEAAMARLTELDVKIAGIEAQLEHNVEHHDPTAYNRWRNSATGALGWVKAEKKFVERWIEDQNPRNSRDRKVAELTAFVEERAAYFSRTFLDRYGGHLPAPPTDEIPAILLVLGQLARECNAALTECSQRSTLLNLSNNDTAKMRKPLGAINHSILQAINHLKTRIAPVKKFDRFGFLITLMNRAIAEGFTLTEEESATYKKILSEQSTPNDSTHT